MVLSCRNASIALADILYLNTYNFYVCELLNDVVEEVCLEDLAELDLFTIGTAYSEVFGAIFPKGKKDRCVLF